MLRQDPALPSTPHTRSQVPGFRLTETPSLPGTPGTPLGPGLPGSPVAPSTPSEMVGHTSHGSPCPQGQQDAPLGWGVLGVAPKMPQAVPSPGDGHRGGAVPAGAAVPMAMAQRGMAQPPAGPPCRCTHLVSFRPQDAGGSLQEEGRGQGCFGETKVCPGNATPHPPAQPPAVARDRPSPKRDRQLSQTPLCAWAWSPSLLRPSSPNPEPRNPSLTPGFGSGLTVLTGVPGDPPGPGAPELPWSQRRENLSPAREKATALGTPSTLLPPGGIPAPPPPRQDLGHPAGACPAGGTASQH